MKKISISLVVVLALFLTGQADAAKEKPTAQEWFQEGLAAETQGAYTEAIRLYTEAIAVDSTYAEAYFKRAKARRIQDLTSPKEAMEDFNATIALEPARAEAYYERGMLNAFLINNERAMSDMRTAAGLGHEGALKWLATDKEEKVAVAEAEAPRQTAVAQEESGGVEMERRPLGLSEILPPGSEPRVYFEFNMATLRDEDMTLLNDIAFALKDRLPEATLIVNGYADAIGAERYNEQLSLQRAQAVAAYLTNEHQIPPGRITVKGYGEKDPLATNQTEEGRAKNRRAEIHLGTGR
jgi:outer membrane protein OmpA-like peptidoglycan-associated protein